MKYSDIAIIDTLVAGKKTQFEAVGITVIKVKLIPYGTQMWLLGAGNDGLINIYYSQKKGLSFVDCSRNAVSGAMISILKGLPVESASLNGVNQAEEAFKIWIGSDESGKGDFFGPLVVAGFVTTREMVPELESLGVIDSKKLESGQIHEIGHILTDRYAGHIEVVAPSVTKYNELYCSFGNLNKLLAWGHARIIENLMIAWKRDNSIEIDGAVADQFGDERYIRDALPSMKSIALVQRHRGESNIGVAAASIIARYTFEKMMRRMRTEFGVEFPFGASPSVKKAARQFVVKYGRERMGEVAKLHFRTSREV
jgi:ribonuclease HIII